ncbi:MAG: aminopeptidase, partial [Proteobacteria bacterium]
PENHPVLKSERFAAAEAEVKRFLAGTAPEKLYTKDWTSHEWLHFIRTLPENLNREKMQQLDTAFGFTRSGNSELLFAWLMHVVKQEYQPGYAALEQFLVHTGRRKFLTPLYAELLKSENGKARAKVIYKLARPNYHAVSVSTLDDLFKENS